MPLSNVELSVLEFKRDVLYCCPRITHLDKLERSQNKCIRLIINTFSTKIMPINIRRDYLASKSFSNNTSFIIYKIQSINQQWIFAPWRLPLLCSLATMFLKYKKQTLIVVFSLTCSLPFLQPIPLEALLPKANPQSIFQIFCLLRNKKLSVN